MIIIKELKESDKGRSVVYESQAVPSGYATKEDGIITSWNEHYVFVRYRGDIHSKATRAEDLIFVAGG